ncbi:hypothetical protein ACFUPX_16275, partial [Streptomyces sp. NPDC057302]
MTYSPPPSDADSHRMEAALAHAASMRGVTVSGPQSWGWHGRTLGHRTTHPAHGTCWLRLLSVLADRAGGKLWEGTELAAKAFPAERKPALHALHDWTEDGHAYRAELSAFVDEEWISRAVPQFTGHPAPKITDWACVGGDFHAANLTVGATLLDWEGWG